MPAVLEAVPDAHYVIVGKPTKTAEFRALATELGVASHVHFLGQVEPDCLQRLLGGCDVHVMTSRHTRDEFEGYGIAVVEAALCGKPSVVLGRLGLAEAVVAGETGLVARLADEADTARAVIELLANDWRRLAMGDAAHRRALAEGTWQHRIKRYDDLARVDRRAANLRFAGSDGELVRLLVVSHTPHYRRGATPVGWGPRGGFLRIISSRRYIDEVVHAAPIRDQQHPKLIPYRSDRVRLSKCPRPWRAFARQAGHPARGSGVHHDGPARFNAPTSCTFAARPTSA